MKTWKEIEQEQKDVCKRYNLTWTPVAKELMIAINRSLFTDTQPINGLRHPKQKKIDGWYIWSGYICWVLKNHVFSENYNNFNL